MMNSPKIQMVSGENNVISSLLHNVSGIFFSEIKSYVSSELEDAFIKSFIAHRNFLWACVSVCGCRNIYVSKWKKYTHEYYKSTLNV